MILHFGKDLFAKPADGEPVEIDRLLSKEPSPQFALEIADECRRLGTVPKQNPYLQNLSIIA